MSSGIPRRHKSLQFREAFSSHGRTRNDVSLASIACSDVSIDRRGNRADASGGMPQGALIQIWMSGTEALAAVWTAHSLSEWAHVESHAWSAKKRLPHHEKLSGVQILPESNVEVSPRDGGNMRGAFCSVP